MWEIIGRRIRATSHDRSIHYFHSGISLCGLYKKDELLKSKPVDIKKWTDKHFCGMCKRSLNTYNDIDNLIHRGRTCEQKTIDLIED